MNRGMWMTSCPEVLRILGFKKKDEGNWFLELTEARPVVWGGVSHVVELDGKVSIERNCVSLSSCWKTLNSKKVIKSFVPEPKESRQVFRVFSDSYMLMNILWTRVRILVIYFWTWICYKLSIFTPLSQQCPMYLCGMGHTINVHR